MIKTIKVTIFLAIVAFLSGLSIGYINDLTAPIIEKNSIAAEKFNLELIFPGASFNELEYVDEDNIIISAYEIEGQGYAFKASAKGYNASNPIIVLIGFDQAGTIIDIVPLFEQETKGIGTKCFELYNVETLYIGKGLDDEIDGITGATFTSDAIKKMIDKAQEAYKNIKQENV